MVIGQPAFFSRQEVRQTRSGTALSNWWRLWHERESNLKQFRCLGRWQRDRLTERSPQPRRCPRRIIEIVVVEYDVHVLRFLREFPAPVADIGDFVVGVIVIKTRGDGFAR